MTLTPSSSENYLVWDVTCVDHFVISYDSVASKEGPTVAELAKVGKRNKYFVHKKVVEHCSTFLVPVTVETFGGLGEETFDFIHDLAKHLLPNNSSVFTKHLRQRLSVAVQIRNAVSISAAIAADDGTFDIRIWILLRVHAFLCMHSA